MSRKKKSRKLGQIGVRSVPKDQRSPNTISDRIRRKKGNPAGSRHSATQPVTDQPATKGKQDPRIGSKRPIPLVVEAKESKKPVQAQKTYFSPAQELEALENDDRLGELLDRLDENQTLSRDEQDYVDVKLARHKVLCELLGIDDNGSGDEEEAEKGDSDDLLAQLDTSHLNQYKSE